MEIIEVVILGHTLRAPRDEAEAITRKVAELEARAASIPELLTQLDEVARRHARVERELAIVRAAANAASAALVEQPASQPPTTNPATATRRT